MSFAALGLSPPLLAAVSEQGYDTPTPVQNKAIPAILAGRDVMAAAQTGTGKTAGFTLPLLDRLMKGPQAQPNQARVLILAPTRELAIQVCESVKTYGRHLPLRAAVVYGGVKINPQMMQMRKGVDVLVATPGRLLDLYHHNAIRFKQLEILVLDEADRMLDLGFLPDISKILDLLPGKRQNLMFSATFSDEIRALGRGLLKDPVEISASPRNTAAKTVKQWICPVDKKQKPALLMELIRVQRWGQVLVFTKTREGADKLTQFLTAEGVSATAIHGDKSQVARGKALTNFKNGLVQVLVATDVAARGLDIEQLPQVVNFDLPKVAEDYIHRIGRTGRAGASGQAVSLVSADEFPFLCSIEQLIGQALPRKLIDGFEPNHDVPESRTTHRPLKPKKPKKAKPLNKKPGSNTTQSAGRQRGNDPGKSQNDPRILQKTAAKKKPTAGKAARTHDSNQQGRAVVSADGNQSPRRPAPPFGRSPGR